MHRHFVVLVYARLRTGLFSTSHFHRRPLFHRHFQFDVAGRTPRKLGGDVGLVGLHKHQRSSLSCKVHVIYFDEALVAPPVLQEEAILAAFFSVADQNHGMQADFRAAVSAEVLVDVRIQEVLGDHEAGHQGGAELLEVTDDFY